MQGLLSLYASQLPSEVANLMWRAFFWLIQAGLPPAVLSPNILSKRVETGPSNSIWFGLCANYALSARSTLTVGRTVSDELSQANTIIIR